MSKQQRPPQRAVQPARSDGARDGAEASLEEQTSVGNQALAEHVHSEGLGEVIDLGAVRAEAVPLVERGILALHQEARDPARIEKFVDVIGASRLPADRRESLIEKLVGDQDAAVGIERAAERWFGGAGQEARDAGLAALDGVWQSLHVGAPADGGWAIGEEVLPLGPGVTEGVSVAACAEQLVAELAAARAGEAAGEAVRGFCRDVYLILAWREEEEEEIDLSATPEWEG